MTLSISHFLILFLMFIRITTVLMTAPVFSNRSIPTITKIGFAGLLAFMLLPLVETMTDRSLVVLPTSIGPFLLLVAQEILLGLLIGFVSNIVFMGLAMAAALMGLQTGFRAASMLSPFTNLSSSALDELYTMLAMALFLAVDGHHYFIRGLVHTFEITPTGAFVFTNLTTEHLINLTGEVFVIGIKLSLPVVGTLLLTDLGLGLVARAVPQIQVFFVGMPLKIGLGFITLALTLSLTFPVIKGLFSDMVADILLISGQ